MVEAIQTGVLLGLTLSILIGPVFFALLQTSLQRGLLPAIIFALGITLSDSLYIVLTNLFVERFASSPNVQFFLGIFGGILLLIIGVQTFLKKPVTRDEDIKTGKLQYAGLLLRGFLLNFVHPGVLLFWLGIVSLITTQWSFDVEEKYVLFSSTVITVFLTDVLKAFTASKLSRFLTVTFMLWLNRVMGITLSGFGIKLFLDTLLK